MNKDNLIKAQKDYIKYLTDSIGNHESFAYIRKRTEIKSAFDMEEGARLKDNIKKAEDE